MADAYNRIGDCNLHVRRFDEAKQYYTKAESLGTPAGDYSYYQLALVAGLQKDYTGKVTLLNRLAGKYPNSPYAINALYEKGRSYVQSTTTAQAITAFRELLTNIPKVRSAVKLPPKSVYCIIRKKIMTELSKPTNMLSTNIPAAKKPALPCVT